MSDWSVPRIEQLAPDGAALKAAQGLLKPGKWQNLGRTERLLWGECQGSGANPYQVRVDLLDAAYKCSCPSRKLPCKHTLGLLLLVAGGSAIPTATAPAFVEEWSANRSKRAEARERKEAEPVAIPDPQARTRRVEQRESRILPGLDQLQAWLGDIVQQGLATARTQPPTFWSQMAARLVDAQAPGLARRVQELADRSVSGSHWQSTLLAGIARLQLLIDAYRRIVELPDDLASEIRTLVGWTQDQESLRQGTGVRDRWLVLGRRQVPDEQLRTQFTWLRGVETSRLALILEFAVGNQPLPASFTVGQVVDTELVFFAGCPQLRALEKQRHAIGAPRYELDNCIDIAGMQAEFASSLARNPWLERMPALLGPVTPIMVADSVQLVDAQGRRVTLPTSFAHGWNLVALASGGPVQVFGEWNGYRFDPITIGQGRHLFTVARLGDLPILSRVA